MAVQGHGIADVVSRDNYLVDDSCFEAIGTFILNCMTPMTMSIQGDWGVGKSTAIKQIERIINEKIAEASLQNYSDSEIPEEERPVFPIIEFNTWQYSKFGTDANLITHLLFHLAKKVHECSPGAVPEESLFAKLGRGLKAGAHIGLNVVASLAESRVGFIAEKGKEALEEQLMSPPETEISDLEEMKAELSQEIREIVRGGRLIVFIDDLDRLEPRQAIELLESLKVFLDLENCVFILAMDQEVVFQGIKSKYGEDFEAEKGRKFFDKIIQVPFDLPVRQYNIKRYMKHLLQESHLEQDASEEKLNRYVDAVSILGDTNPRSIKRLLNQLALYELILQEGLQNIPDGEFYLFVFLMYQKIAAYRKSTEKKSDRSIVKKSLLDVGSIDELNLFLEQEPDLQMALGIAIDDTEAEEFMTEEEKALRESGNQEIRQNFFAAMELLEAMSLQGDTAGDMSFEAFHSDLIHRHHLDCREATERNKTTPGYTFLDGDTKILKVSTINDDGSFNIVVYRGYYDQLENLSSHLEQRYGYTQYRYNSGSHGAYAVFIRPSGQIIRDVIIRKYVEKKA